MPEPRHDPALCIYHLPRDLHAHTTAFLVYAAIKVHRALGCDGYSLHGIMGVHANADEDGLLIQARCGEARACCIGVAAD